MAGYPDYQTFAYSFARAELSLDADIYIDISNVTFSQPTTEEFVMGTKPYPLARTEGEMSGGTGTVTFSSVSGRERFIEKLGNGFRSKIWSLNWILTAAGAAPIKYECFGCRVTDNPVNQGQGAAALSGDITFSFMAHTVNGASPHTL